MLQDKHGIDKSRTEVQEKPKADEGHPGVCQSSSANDPAPVHILIKEEGATAWLQGKEWSSKVTQFPPLLPDCLNKALQDQVQIGWMQALKGYLSIEWQHSAAKGTSASEDYQEEGRGMRQVRTVQRALHQLTQTLWKSQNQILHGSTEMEWKQIRDSELAEIKEIHKQHPERIPAGERHY
jgi:hypothetical protein